MGGLYHITDTSGLLQHCTESEPPNIKTCFMQNVCKKMRSQMDCNFGLNAKKSPDIYLKKRIMSEHDDPTY